MTCPDCEYNKRRAQLWRNEAYKLGGHPLGWEPELMIRPKPLSEDALSKIIDAEIGFNSCVGWEEGFARAIERAHGIGEKE